MTALIRKNALFKKGIFIAICSLAKNRTWIYSLGNYYSIH